MDSDSKEQSKLSPIKNHDTTQETNKSVNSSPDAMAHTNNGTQATTSTNLVSKAATPRYRRPIEIKSLNWNDYLNFCNGKPAPAECFCQNPEPPKNEFQFKHKLVIDGPDLKDLAHLATVVGVYGPRLQLRLDGCDNLNDVFVLVDSETINPVGTDNLKLFSAPLRYRKDSLKYHSFCQQVLKKSVAAPKECFKSRPQRPKRNMFEAGMKLEAVDNKHPSNICPATIKSVDGIYVEIHLDGWDSKNDYKCPYYSRNLFPVGWCERAGLILQYPGPKAEYRANENSLKRRNEITINSQTSAENDSNQLANKKLKVNDTNHFDNNKNSEKQHNEVGSKKSKKLVNDDISPKDTIKINSSKVAAIKSTNSGDNLKPNSNVSSHTNTSKNKTIDLGAISKKESLKSLPTLQKTDSNQSTNTNSDNCDLKNHLNFVVTNKRSFDHLQTNSSTTTPTTANINDKQIKINGNQNMSNSSFKDEHQQLNLQNNSNAFDQELPSKNSVESWSVDQLLNFLSSRFPETYKIEQQFRSQEIDGKAFLMLTNDLMMKFMNIKLGCSLKLISLIEKINKEYPC